LLLRDDAKLAFGGDLPDSVVLDKGRQIGVYALVLLIAAVSSILGLTNVGINVAVERDWCVNSFQSISLQVNKQVAGSLQLQTGRQHASQH